MGERSDHAFDVIIVGGGGNTFTKSGFAAVGDNGARASPDTKDCGEPGFLGDRCGWAGTDTPDGRFDEAERLLEEARAVPPPGSGVRVMAAAAEALLLAHRGELAQAEALARTAVATAETRTDTVWWQALTHEDLATVLERAARIDEARDALERALTIWERKGCLPCAERVREQIPSLGEAQV